MKKSGVTYQIELLTNLDKVPEAGAIVVMASPKPKGGLGFPARIIATVPRLELVPAHFQGETEMSPSEVNDLLDAIAKVLLRCVVIGVLILLLSFGMVLVGGDVAYSIHSKWFDITRHEFDLIVYCSLTLGKTCVALFFLVPWLSIRLVLRKRK